jgi:H+/Cl- antiporter ClcA
MNRRIPPPAQDTKLWLSVLVFLAVLAFVGLLSVDDFEPTERRGTTEIDP